MSLSAVHHVALTVTDLQRSIAFYRDILGFHPMLDISIEGSNMERLLQLHPGTTGRSVILQQGSEPIGQVELIQFDPPLDPSTKPKRPGDPGVFLLSFQVQDEELQAVYLRLQERGVRFYTDPQGVSFAGLGSARAVVCEDPDGIMIELIQLPTPDEIRRARAAQRAQQD